MWCGIKNVVTISLFSFALILECREYAKYVYVNENSPVLRASAKSDTISKCGIVETPLIVGGQRVNENEFPHMVRFDVGGQMFHDMIIFFIFI